MGSMSGAAAFPDDGELSPCWGCAMNCASGMLKATRKFREEPDMFKWLGHVVRAICLSDQSSLIEASLQRNRYQEMNRGKPLWERNSLNRLRFKQFQEHLLRYGVMSLFCYQCALKGTVVTNQKKRIAVNGEIVLCNRALVKPNFRGSEMPLNLLFLKSQNRSRLKPYYWSTFTAVKELGRNADSQIFEDFSCS